MAAETSVRVRIRIGDVGIIRGVKPGEDVRGLVSARWAGQWSRPIEGSFFEIEVARIYLFADAVFTSRWRSQLGRDSERLGLPTVMLGMVTVMDAIRITPGVCRGSASITGGLPPRDGRTGARTLRTTPIGVRAEFWICSSVRKTVSKLSACGAVLTASTTGRIDRSRKTTSSSSSSVSRRMLNVVLATSIGTVTVQTATRTGLPAAPTTFWHLSSIILPTEAARRGRKLEVNVTIDPLRAGHLG